MNRERRVLTIEAGYAPRRGADLFERVFKFAEQFGMKAVECVSYRDMGLLGAGLVPVGKTESGKTIFRAQIHGQRI